MESWPDNRRRNTKKKTSPAVAHGNRGKTPAKSIRQDWKKEKKTGDKTATACNESQKGPHKIHQKTGQTIIKRRCGGHRAKREGSGAMKMP